MKPPTVRVMDAADEDSAVAIITLAFAADPMARWTWPNAGQYLEGSCQTNCTDGILSRAG